jgi:beta-lactamase superfamily II metal-dependent hydrolase
VKLSVFPAGDGDCLLLSYSQGPEKYVLIDGGRKGAYRTLSPRLREIAAGGGRIEVMVLTHIDADHIEGLLAMIEDEPYIPVDEVWFNGFEQLSTVRAQGPGQGDKFSAALKSRRIEINARFGHSAIVVPDLGGLSAVQLPGGLNITVISPDRRRLDDLQTSWSKWRDREAEEAVVAKAPKVSELEVFGRKPMPEIIDVEKLAAGIEHVDDEVPNGSSIAFVAEFGGKRVLFGADAHPDLILANIERVKARMPDFAIDLYKVSHHGSIGNTTRALAEALDCGRFVISSNGARHGHPDPEAIAKLVKHGKSGPKELFFNYMSERTSPWNDQGLCRKWNYTCRIPSSAGAPLEIDV